MEQMSRNIRGGPAVFEESAVFEERAHPNGVPTPAPPGVQTSAAAPAQ